MQELARRVAVRFLEFEEGHRTHAVARAVQEQGLAIRVGAQPCLKYALAQANGRFRHGDENDGTGQAGGNLRGQVVVNGLHGARRDGPVLAQHFGQEQEAALGVGARGKADQPVQRKARLVHCQGQLARGHLLLDDVHGSSTA